MNCRPVYAATVASTLPPNWPQHESQALETLQNHLKRTLETKRVTPHQQLNKLDDNHRIMITRTI